MEFQTVDVGPPIPPSRPAETLPTSRAVETLPPSRPLEMLVAGTLKLSGRPESTLSNASSTSTGKNLFSD